MGRKGVTAMSDSGPRLPSFASFEPQYSLRAPHNNKVGQQKRERPACIVIEIVNNLCPGFAHI